jgi:DNA-binding NarL/FixJ family response regulator
MSTCAQTLDDEDFEIQVGATALTPEEIRVVPSEEVPFPELTDRERAVALRLSIGDKNSEVAAALNISIKTVDTHRAHALKKLKCRNNVDLARLAIRLGYVQP